MAAPKGKPAGAGWGVTMGDWRKTQYKIGPSPDPLSDPMAGENLWFGIGLPLLIGGLFLGGVVALIVWLLTL